MLFLLHLFFYVTAIGAGTLGVGFWNICIGILLFGILFLLENKRSIFIIFGLGIISLFGWNIGISHYRENIKNWGYLHEYTNGYTKSVFITGKVKDVAYRGDFTSTYRLNIDNIDTQSTQGNTLTIYIEAPKNLTIRRNDMLAFTGKISSILELPITGFERYAWKDSIFGKMYITNYAILKRGNISIFDTIQEWSEKTIFRGFPRDVAALILGMTVGNTNLLREGLKDDFMLSGMTHILVVSGSNIAFVIIFILFFLRYINASRNTRIGIVALFVLLYGTLVGWDAPVVRATCMGILTYMSLQFNSRISSIVLLLFIGAIYVSVYPLMLIFDAGFGLSFGATFGILLFQKKIGTWMSSLGIHRFLGEILSITSSAMIGSIPVLIYHFGTLSSGGVLANILIAPILGPLLFLCVGYLSLAGMGLTHLYYPGLIIYLPSKIVLIITSFFSLGGQIVIPEYLRPVITLVLLGGLVIFLFLNETVAIVAKNQTMSKHPEEHLSK